MFSLVLLAGGFGAPTDPPPIVADPPPIVARVEIPDPPPAVVSVVPAPRERYDPYGKSNYSDFYRAVESGSVGILVVGIPDKYVSSYWTHVWVPSGYLPGFEDGDWLCQMVNGVMTIKPYKEEEFFKREVGLRYEVPVFQPQSVRSSGVQYDADHSCPVCGRIATIQSGRGPAAGSHLHTCSAGHTWWHYDAGSAGTSSGFFMRRFGLR